MAFAFRYERKIEFADTDMAGIVHFSNYFRFMEVAEHAFLRSLGLSVHAEKEGRLISWPRVEASCVYAAPLAFEDTLVVLLLVREIKKKTITYEFTFKKEGSVNVGTGRMTVVCAAIDPHTKKMSAIPIPDEIRSKIDVAPSELLAPH